MSDCIFCKIIAGEIPASKVYEDEQVLAFLDISQVTPGHTLVVPKEHYRNLLEMDATSASQLFAQVPKVAQKVMKATKAAGMNIIANCEEIAGQTVFHTHVHLVPRYGADDDLKIDFIAHEPDFDKLAQVAETITTAYGVAMKLSHLLLFAGAAAGSYLVPKNRQTITDEVLNTTDRVQAIKDDVDIIQNSLQIIDQQKELIKEYQEDLTYKFKVLEKDIQTRLAVIKETQEIEDK